MRTPFLAGSILVASALTLAAAASAGGNGAFQARPGLKIDAELGGALPTGRGLTEVSVDCPDTHARLPCPGTITLLPRGAKTKALVGSAPIARRSVKVRSGSTKLFKLQLSRKARAALRGGKHWLDVLVEVRSNGKRRTHQAIADDFRPVLGHAEPDNIHTRVRYAKDGSALVTSTYSWDWHIKVRSYLELPNFKCPAWAPNVDSNGRVIYTGDARGRHTVEAGHKANMEARAKQGTGWSNFTDFWTTYHGGGGTPSGHAYWSLQGWKKGGLWTNSVWAPALFEDGHFSLKVVCQSSSNLNEIARVEEWDYTDPVDMLPWYL
jgi:hypothetical protein